MIADLNIGFVANEEAKMLFLVEDLDSIETGLAKRGAPLKPCSAIKKAVALYHPYTVFVAVAAPDLDDHLLKVLQEEDAGGRKREELVNQLLDLRGVETVPEGESEGSSIPSRS